MLQYYDILLLLKLLLLLLLKPRMIEYHTADVPRYMGTGYLVAAAAAT